jgi:hypothetical protein
VGLPGGVWWKALLALALLQEVCRWVTPAAANVNLAFAIYPGWERWFPSHLAYRLTLGVLMGAGYFGVELGLRRLFSSPG